MATTGYAPSNAGYAANVSSNTHANPSDVILAVLMTLAGCTGVYFFVAVLLALIAHL